MAYENFMCNKDFHPSNFRNLRKVWEAEQRKKLEAKRQEDLRLQYLKEQEVYKSKELMGKANPLNFMYEPPPGFAKDKEKGQASEEGGGETKMKFDWQRPGRAPPREEYARDMEIRDKPFGIEVRNVKCLKCGKWGHINTDRECPLYGKAKPAPAEGAPPQPAPLPDLDTMEDGLIFRQCVRDRVVDSAASNQQILASDEETEVQELLAGFSRKEQKKILKKLARMETQEDGSVRHKKKREKVKKHKKRSTHSESGSESGAESGSGERERRRGVESGSSERERRRRKRHKKHRTRSTSSESSLSEDDSDGRRKRADDSDGRRRKRARRHRSLSRECSPTDRGGRGKVKGSSKRGEDEKRTHGSSRGSHREDFQGEDKGYSRHNRKAVADADGHTHKDHRGSSDDGRTSRDHHSHSSQGHSVTGHDSRESQRHGREVAPGHRSDHYSHQDRATQRDGSLHRHSRNKT